MIQLPIIINNRMDTSWAAQNKMNKINKNFDLIENNIARIIIVQNETCESGFLIYYLLFLKTY